MKNFFDTIWPAGGIVYEPENERILQFYNYAYEIQVLNLKGERQSVIQLASTAYQAPDMKKAARVSGAKEEKSFRTEFTPFSGLHRLGTGYVTVLAQFDALGNEEERLEVWDADFESLGYYTLPGQKFLGTHGRRLVFYDLSGESPKLIFRELSVAANAAQISIQKEQL